MKSLEHSFIIQQNIHFSSVHGTHFSLHYSGVLPAVKTSHSPVCQYHSTQNEKTVTIQLCQYRYPSSNNDWLLHNELEWMWKWSRPVWSTTATFAWRDRKKAMKICQASWCHRKDSNQVIPSEPIPSVGLHIIFHHHYQNKCLIYIPVYVSMYIL